MPIMTPKAPKVPKAATASPDAQVTRCWHGHRCLMAVFAATAPQLLALLSCCLLLPRLPWLPRLPSFTRPPHDIYVTHCWHGHRCLMAAFAATAPQLLALLSCCLLLPRLPWLPRLPRLPRPSTAVKLSSFQACQLLAIHSAWGLEG